LFFRYNKRMPHHKRINLKASTEVLTQRLRRVLQAGKEYSLDTSNNSYTTINSNRNIMLWFEFFKEMKLNVAYSNNELIWGRLFSNEI